MGTLHGACSGKPFRRWLSLSLLSLSLSSALRFVGFEGFGFGRIAAAAAATRDTGRIGHSCGPVGPWAHGRWGNDGNR